MQKKRGPEKYSVRTGINLDYQNIESLVTYKDARNLEGLPISRIVNTALREFFKLLSNSEKA
jgi:hypothetical protein